MLTMRPTSTTPNIDLILQTIRTLESHNNYTAQNRTSSASGAYQIIDSTWAGFGGYRRAKDAPPAVQDQKARIMVLSYLQRAGGDVRAVPQFWYYPAGYGKPNLVPPGNRLSMGQYTESWMRIYNSLGGAGGATSVPGGAPSSLGNVELASSSDNGEHCLLKLPGVDLGPFTLGKNCLLSTNQARAVGGGLLVGIGGIIMLTGLSLIVLGKVPVPLPGPAGVVSQAAGAMSKRREDRQFMRAATQGAENKANAPMHNVGGKQTMGNYEEPF